MMQNTPPDTPNERAIADWFATIGLNVEVVDHCPGASCEHCRETLDRAA
jgi:hypothetical protein